VKAQVQYVRAADGTALAYCVQGAGPPVLWLPAFASHLDYSWDVGTNRAQFDWITTHFRLVRTDYRGTGLSQRGVVERSIDLVVADLRTVMSCVGNDPCVVIAIGPSTIVALAFAARFPESVSQLVLFNPFLSGHGLSALLGMQEVLPLVDRDWETFTFMVANLAYGWSADVARQAATVFRHAVTAAEYKATLAALEAMDVTDLLPQIATPTLIFSSRDAYLAEPEITRRVAAGLSNARVVSVAGRFVARFDAEIAAAVAEFLGVPPAAAAPLPASRHGTAVILLADVADSTVLTERFGDSAFRARARDLDGALRDIIRESDGTPVEGKLLGDGVLAVFNSARGAIEAALRCQDAGAAAGLGLHLGIHAGDVIHEGENVYGGAVNVAARVAAVAVPGEVLVTDTVRALARTSADVAFVDRGEHALRGVADPQRLFAVGPR